MIRNPGPRRAALTGLALILGAPACHSWHPAGVPEVQQAPGRSVLVWSGGQKFRVDDARVIGDSLVGRAAAGEHERLAFGLASIDSIRVRQLDLGKTAVTAFGIVPAAAAMVLWLTLPDGPDP